MVLGRAAHEHNIAMSSSSAAAALSDITHSAMDQRSPLPSAAAAYLPTDNQQQKHYDPRNRYPSRKLSQ